VLGGKHALTLQHTEASSLTGISKKNEKNNEKKTVKHSVT